MTIGASANKSTSTTNQTQNSTGTQTNDPWSAVIPYVTGDNGVLAKAAALYSKNGTASPDLTAAFGDLVNAGRSNATTAAGLTSSLTPAQQVTAKYITGDNSVDPTKALSSLGAVDPTKALSGILSDNGSNPYLTSQLTANTDSAKAAYQDLLGDATDNLTRSVLPAIRSGANLSGTYGGSRQGVAQGVAVGDTNKQLTRSAQSLASNLAQTNANALSGSYESAQDRKASAAQMLAGLGINTATTNADRALDTSKFNVNTDADLNKFNSGLTLQNNQQQIDAAKAGSDLTGSAYDRILEGLTGGAGYDQAQLQSFADLIAQYAGLGGTTNSNETTTGNSTTKGKSLGVSAKYTYGG